MTRGDQAFSKKFLLATRRECDENFSKIGMAEMFVGRRKWLFEVKGVGVAFVQSSLGKEACPTRSLALNWISLEICDIA